MSLAERLARSLAAVPPGPLGVAVSGGGDSVALLLLLQATGRTVAAVTVDHGLRPESADEAAGVAALCAARGISHEVRRWDGAAEGGNLQMRAREARRRLITEWAQARGIGSVALGHTRDDQAETFLLRLARGSGVDGLSGMAPAVAAGGMLWVRPLLEAGREELRRWLSAEGVGWIEDPSNSDLRFDRARARAALPLLAPLGLGTGRLAATARAMARAREALERATADLAPAALRDGGAGDLLLDPAALSGVAEELRLRLLSAALCWVSGAAYRPRLARLEPVLAAVEAGRIGHGLTLHGCVLRMRGPRVAIRREVGRMAAAVPLTVRRWDGRWEVEGDGREPHLTIGALGAGGLAQLPDHRVGIARESLAATPAIWDAGRLVAAPIARPGPDFTARRIAALTPVWDMTLLR